MKALVLECQQGGQAGCHLMHGGMAQRGDLQHHLVGRQQLQVLAGQAFVSAVHEHELGADQIFLSSMREGRKDQRRV